MGVATWRKTPSSLPGSNAFSVDTLLSVIFLEEPSARGLNGGHSAASACPRPHPCARLDPYGSFFMEGPAPAGARNHGPSAGSSIGGQSGGRAEARSPETRGSPCLWPSRDPSSGTASPSRWWLSEGPCSSRSATSQIRSGAFRPRIKHRMRKSTSLRNRGPARDLKAGRRRFPVSPFFYVRNCGDARGPRRPKAFMP